MKQKGYRGWLYSAPFLVAVVLIVVLPLFYTVYISFTNMSIYHWFEYQTVGLDNSLQATDYTRNWPFFPLRPFWFRFPYWLSFS